MQPVRLKMFTKNYGNMQWINLTHSISVFLNEAKQDYFSAYLNKNLHAALALTMLNFVYL